MSADKKTIFIYPSLENNKKSLKKLCLNCFLLNKKSNNLSDKESVITGNKNMIISQKVSAHMLKM
jgi:hypothetical protein